MKKIALFTTIFAIAMISCNSNESAFSEEQKTEQDSLDKLKQEDEFDQLENDSTNSDTSNNK